MATKLINLIALSALAILASSFGPTPVTAVSLTSPNVHARHLGSHAFLAKKKRADAARPKCKPRPSSTKPAPPPATPKPNPPAPPKPPTGNPPPSGGSGKGGLAWAAGGETALLRAFKRPQVGKIYNWSPYPVAGAAEAGYEYVPMFWGRQTISAMQSLPKGKYRFILGFNEPDHPSQSQMSPGEACDLWKRYMYPLRAAGASLGSPAVANGDRGRAWFQQFVQICGKDSFDFSAVHWYGIDLQNFKDHINFYVGLGKPVWVTEFAAMNFGGGRQLSMGEIKQFAGAATSFLKSNGAVQEYFPYGVQRNMGNVIYENCLVAGNGPSELANIYFS